MTAHEAFQQGQEKEHAHDLENAIVCYRRAAAISPENGQYQAPLAHALYVKIMQRRREGQQDLDGGAHSMTFDEARQYIADQDEALKAHTSAESHGVASALFLTEAAHLFLIGITHAAKAPVLCDKALDLDANCPLALFVRALLYGDTKRGLEYMKRTLSLEPDNPDFAYEVGVRLARSGDNHESRSARGGDVLLPKVLAVGTEIQKCGLVAAALPGAQMSGLMKLARSNNGAQWTALRAATDAER